MQEEINGQRTVVQQSLRVYSEDRELYKRIKDETGLPTDAQVFAQLVHAFYDPVQIKDDREVLRREAEAARAGEAKAMEENKALLERIEALEREKEALGQRLTGAENRAAEEANRLQLEYERREAELREQQQPRENEYRLTIPPDYYKALQMVAARESKRRGQAWTPSHVVAFFIYSRFIKGSLNGDLCSLSDSELRAAGISLKPQKQEVDL